MARARFLTYIIVKRAENMEMTLYLPISLQCFQALPVFIHVAVTQQRETRNSSFQRIVFVTPIQSAVEKGHCDKVTLIEKQYYVYYVILLGFSCVAKP